MPDAARKMQTSKIHMDSLKALMVKWHKFKSCHPSSCEAFLLCMRVQLLQKKWGEKTRGILFPKTSNIRSHKPVELETSLNPQNFSRD